MLIRRALPGAFVSVLLCSAACGGSGGASTAAPPTAAQPASTPAAAPAAAAGPIDVCRIVTPDKATAILGSLAPQPPVKTDHGGFGTDRCTYLGPALSGEGAQTVFSHLSVEAARGKDGADIMQYYVDKQKATIDMPGVGSSAKRNQAGSFVWASSGSVACTAEIGNGLPNGLTPDAAAGKLAGLCRDILSAAR